MTDVQSQETGDDNPFTAEVREKVLQVEKNTSAEEGWTSLKKSDDCEVWKKKDPNSPADLVKGFLTFKELPPHSMVDILTDMKSRSKWDKLYPVNEVLETHKHYKIQYRLAKLPPGVSDRDMVQKVTCYHEEDTNTTYLYYENATHPERPERSGTIRAEIVFLSVIVRPHPNDPNSTQMTLMVQLDMKGWIPSAIINNLTVKVPEKWLNNLSTYYRDVYSKEKKAEGDEGGATPST